MTVAELPIQIDEAQIAAFCRARGIRRFALFGSVLHGDFDSRRRDLDVLVELQPDAHPGFSFFIT
ncbi:MAG: hypothetical protein HY360_06240 [Verrucomicrobia bacterium]|nr:hypothetical protein [Verrucomicrobiota bacterium]